MKVRELRSQRHLGLGQSRKRAKISLCYACGVMLPGKLAQMYIRAMLAVGCVAPFLLIGIFCYIFEVFGRSVHYLYSNSQAHYESFLPHLL